MDKTLKHALVLFIATWLAACGGGKDEKPPAASTPEGNKSLPNLHSLAQAAKQECCQTFGPFMVNYGMAVQNVPGLGTTGGFQTPGLPPSNGCRDSLMNFELVFRTIDNGQYANQSGPQQWREQQGIGMVNCVGDMMAGAGLPTDPTNFPQYFMAAMMITREIGSAVPSANTSSYVEAMRPGTGVPAPVVVVPPPGAPQTLPLLPGQQVAFGGGGFPFNDQTQVMPFLPPIPSGF